MEEDLNKLSNLLGDKCYVNELIRDLNTEPKIVCDYKKRRKCDSYYIKLYEVLYKKYVKLEEENRINKELLKIYQSVLNDVVDDLKGGETMDKKDLITILEYFKDKDLSDNKELEIVVKKLDIQKQNFDIQEEANAKLDELRKQFEELNK